MNFHGVNVPLSSLRSKKSCGIGEFYDLIPLIDWCSEVGMNIIQLLPLNDTGYDTSPYNAITSIALHPIYISLQAFKKPPLANFKKENQSKRIQYTQVYEKKVGYLRKFFDRKEYDREEFTKFKRKNSPLKRYALYKILREKSNFTSWKEWPKHLQNPTESTFRTQFKKYADEIEFHLFMQFIAYEQLMNVKRHAHNKNVSLMGDIPILISPESADVWANQKFFNLKLAAGAPPDDFNKEGQYWGFPLYRWNAMKKDGFKWWKRRLEYAQHFYDYFRIDHVIGFYRIWGIPLNELATQGKYYPEKVDQFSRQGHTVLKKLLSFTHMHPIGEDLGSHPVTPPSIRKSLAQLGIDRTLVIRWEKHRSNGRFIPYSKYPTHSMTSLSTHDTETLEQWWTQFPNEAKRFAKFSKIPYRKKLTSKMREKILHDAHALPSRFHINLLQEYLALYPELVAKDPNDERINRPGSIAPTNWTYRYRLPIEKITQHAKLKSTIQKLTKRRSK